MALIICLLGAAAGFSQQPAGTGKLVGTIRFLGKVPPPRMILTTDGGTIRHNDIVVDERTNGLRYVVLTLDHPAVKMDKPRPPAVIDQRDMVFLPRVVAVHDGQKVRFENNDLSNHGVQSAALREENKFAVNVGPNQPFEFTFRAEKTPVVIGCQIHAWMKAYVVVAKHPFVAVTDAKGAFQIPDIPAGKYALQFHHIDTDRREKRMIEVLPGKTTELSIEWK